MPMRRPGGHSGKYRYGPRSLVAICQRIAVNNADRLSEDILEPVPEKLLRGIWKELEIARSSGTEEAPTTVSLLTMKRSRATANRCKPATREWKIFSKLILKSAFNDAAANPEKEITVPVSLYYQYHGVEDRDLPDNSLAKSLSRLDFFSAFTAVNSTWPFFSHDVSFLTRLDINLHPLSGLPPPPSSSIRVGLISLAGLPNLSTLSIHTGGRGMDSSDIELLDDRLVRGWCDTQGAFPVLHGLKLVPGDNRGLTTRSLEYASQFPQLQVVQLYLSPESRGYRNHDWQDAFGWTVAVDEYALIDSRGILNLREKIIGGQESFVHLNPSPPWLGNSCEYVCPKPLLDVQFGPAVSRRLDGANRSLAFVRNRDSSSNNANGQPRQADQAAAGEKKRNLKSMPSQETPQGSKSQTSGVKRSRADNEARDKGKKGKSKSIGDLLSQFT